MFPSCETSPVFELFIILLNYDRCPVETVLVSNLTFILTSDKATYLQHFLQTWMSWDCHFSNSATKAAFELRFPEFYAN